MSNEHPDMHGNWVDGPDDEHEDWPDSVETNEHHTFEVWCQAFDEWYRKAVGSSLDSYTLATSVECWRAYYNDGMTPKEAFLEDCSNAF